MAQLKNRDIPPFMGTPNLRDRITSMSQDYRYLSELKALYGRSPVISAEFEKKRVSYRDSHDNRPVARAHATHFANALKDIDRQHGYPFTRFNDSQDSLIRFLDMGCAPGGFSHYILSENEDSIGVGITKPGTEEAPSLQMAALPTLQDTTRYTTHYLDLIELARTYCEPSDMRPSPLKGPPFHNVIAGAFPTMESHKLILLRPALALSQLLIAFHHILPGGNLAIVLNTKAVLWIVEVLALLKVGFSSVVGSKGGSLHGIRSSGYIICVGFREERRDRLIERLREGLKAIWACQSASLVEQQGDMKDKVDWMDCQALLDPTRTGEEVFAEHALGTLETFEPLWRLQYSNMMAELLRKDRESLEGKDLPSTLEPPSPKSFESRSKLKHLTRPSSSSKKSQNKVSGGNWRDRVADRAGGDLTERSFPRAYTTRRRDAANVRYGGFNGSNSSVPREETVSNWRRK